MSGKGTRASVHNGRAGKSGVFSAKHNDRQFDTSNTDHIDPALTDQNRNIRFGGDYGAATNEEHELAFYQDHFAKSLERKNAGYKAKGKPGQIKTMEQYYRSVRSCPEETLYTVGKDIDPQLLWEIYLDHQEWKARHFPQCQTLDAALHIDEPDAMPHIHERSVWIGHDAKGMEVVGQAKALSEMGVLPPEPGKKYGKYNNAKQTYSRLCREHFINACQEHGLSIIVEPLPPDKVGLELTEYKIQHSQERLEEATRQASEADKTLQALQEDKYTLEGEKEALKGEIEALQGEKEILTTAEVKALNGDKTFFGGLKGVTYKEFEALKRTATAVDRMTAERDKALARAERAEQKADAAYQDASRQLQEKIQEVEADRPSTKMWMENLQLQAENKRLKAKLAGLQDTIRHLLQIIEEKLPGIYEIIMQRKHLEQQEPDRNQRKTKSKGFEL